MKYILLSLSCLLSSSHALADTPNLFDDNGFVTQQHALTCIQLNKDMNLASEQMLETESSKNHLKGKINSLQIEIQKRRKLIEKLDQQHNQTNNEDYNILVMQFEDLVDERKQTITLYKNRNLHLTTQHESVIRLEQRFSEQCLIKFKITEQMHKDVCGSENIRWCQL